MKKFSSVCDSCAEEVKYDPKRIKFTRDGGGVYGVDGEGIEEMKTHHLEKGGGMTGDHNFFEIPDKGRFNISSAGSVYISSERQRR